MSFLYYFRECPTCKNYNRNLVRECALRGKVELDERYIRALPDVWGEEASKLGEDGAVVPFLYNSETDEFLNVNYAEEGMEKEIEDFLGIIDKDGEEC